MDSATSEATASSFIRALYSPDQHVAVLAVGRGEGGGVHQRITLAEAAAAGRFQRWLRHLNARRHDIFIGMNPMTAGTRGREKSDVHQVARLQLDLDADGPQSLRAVLADAAAGRLPPPAIVVRSSKDHYQVLWNTSPGWKPDQAEDTMARLAERYGGDNVNDVSRCMRLPGFRNKKDGRDDAAVTWTDNGGGPVRPEQFSHLPPAAQKARDPGIPGGGPRGPRKGPLSQSERDWAAVCDRLRNGADPATVTAELEAARPDKAKPRDYAERTVRKALARVRRGGRTR